MISKYAFHINVVYYNLSFLIMVSFFFWGLILGALTLRSGNLAVKDESERLRSASWRTSLCDTKTNQTVTVGSCLDFDAVGTCLSGVFVCCDGLWGGKPSHSIGLGIQSSWRTGHTKAQCDGVITVTAQTLGGCANFVTDGFVWLPCPALLKSPCPKTIHQNPLNNMFTNQNWEDRL